MYEAINEASIPRDTFVKLIHHVSLVKKLIKLTIAIIIKINNIGMPN